MKKIAVITLFVMFVLVLSACAPASLAEQAKNAEATRTALVGQVKDAANALDMTVVDGTSVPVSVVTQPSSASSPSSVSQTVTIVQPSDGAAASGNVQPNGVPSIVAQPTSGAPIQVVGSDGPYDCSGNTNSGNCLTDPNGWLRGRGALKVIFFKAGESLSFLSDGMWSLHFETLTAQLSPVGVFDVPAFGSIADVSSASQIKSFVARSNGAAILWQDSSHRAEACRRWNAEVIQPNHKDWTLKSELCR